MPPLLEGRGAITPTGAGVGSQHGEPPAPRSLGTRAAPSPGRASPKEAAAAPPSPKGGEGVPGSGLGPSPPGSQARGAQGGSAVRVCSTGGFPKAQRANRCAPVRSYGVVRIKLI